MATYQGPNGWTADSVVGAINAAAQAPIRAEDLLTGTSDARDPALASRTWKNPYTGVRDPAVIGSVYAQSDTPAWLANEVAALNAEQALRRSAQAEVFNQVFNKAANTNDYRWLEVLRAAVLQPGVEAGFGSGIADPNVGLALQKEAIAKDKAATAYQNTLNAASAARAALLREQDRQTSNPFMTSGWHVYPQQTDAKSRDLERASESADKVAAAVFGGNPFATQNGYIGGGTYGATVSGNPYGSTATLNPYASTTGYVRGPATNAAQSWAGGYVGPTQFSVDNPAYNTYSGSNFFNPATISGARTITPTWVR